MRETLSRRRCCLLMALMWLAGCAPTHDSAREVQLRTEVECYVALSYHACRIAHDKAGGYPITHGFETD